MSFKKVIIILLFILGIVGVGAVVFSGFSGDFQVAFFLERSFISVIEFFKEIMNSFNRAFSEFAAKFRY